VAKISVLLRCGGLALRAGLDTGKVRDFYGLTGFTTFTCCDSNQNGQRTIANIGSLI